MKITVDELAGVLECPVGVAGAAAEFAAALAAGSQIVCLRMDGEARAACDGMRAELGLDSDESLLATAFALIETLIAHRRLGFSVLRPHDPATKDWREVQVWERGA